jgi:hypothetical protein
MMVLITGLATCGRTAWKSLCLFLVLVLVIVLTRTSTSTRILSTWAVGVADAMIEPQMITAWYSQTQGIRHAAPTKKG